MCWTFFFANRLFHFWDYSNQNSYHLLVWRCSRVGNELESRLNYWFSPNFGKFSLNSAHTTTSFVSSSFCRTERGHSWDIFCVAAASPHLNQFVSSLLFSPQKPFRKPFSSLCANLGRTNVVKIENLAKTAWCCRISRMISEEHLSTMGPRVKTNFRRKK